MDLIGRLNYHLSRITLVFHRLWVTIDGTIHSTSRHIYRPVRPFRKIAAVPAVPDLINVETVVIITKSTVTAAAAAS
jgi:hypothetical protein